MKITKRHFVNLRRWHFSEVVELYCIRSCRICGFCALNRIGDEFHFILECPKYSNLWCIDVKKKKVFLVSAFLF